MLDAVFVLLLTLPWLNPFAPGPLSALGPWLFSAGCAAVLWGAYGLAPTHRRAETLARAVLGAWLGAAVISVGVGLLQYAGVAGKLTPWVNGAPWGEAFGNLRQRNLFASLTSLGLVALLGWVGWAHQGVGGARGSNRRWGWVSAPVLAAAWLGVGNAASSSRTGLLQGVLLLGLMLLWGRWREPGVRRVLVAAVLGYAVATVALPWLAGLDPLTSSAWARLRAGDAACSGRLTLWGNVLHLIAQKPWLGWGWGALDEAHFMAQYPGTRFCAILDNAHNLPLHLAVTLGVPVALTVCAALAWLVWRAQPWRETNALRQVAWAALAVMGLHSLLEFPLWYGPFQMAAGVSVWLLRRPVHERVSAANSYRPFRPLALAVKGLTAMVLTVLFSYVVWDYHRISQLYLRPEQRALAYRDNTLRQAQASWLFRQPVQFAELNTTPLTPANAAHQNALAWSLLSFSPEPRVVQKLIDSAELLGRPQEAALFRARYAAAFSAQAAASLAASVPSQGQPLTSR